MHIKIVKDQPLTFKSEFLRIEDPSIVLLKSFSNDAKVQQALRITVIGLKSAGLIFSCLSVRELLTLGS